MKIKHWQGYGSVEAVRFGKTWIDKYGDAHVTVKVTGNHECGLVRDDKYDLFNWLVKKFYKQAESYRQIKDVIIAEGTVTYNGKPTDSCVYEFIITT